MGSYFTFACAVDVDGELACFGPTTSPEVPSLGAPVLDLALGNAVGCAVGTDQVLECWGNVDAFREPPPSEGSFLAVAVGDHHGCAVTTTGELSCWGAEGQTLPEPPGPISEVAVTFESTCVLTGEGEVICGGPAFTEQDTPPPDGDGFSSLTCGYSHCCVLDGAGAATCWGLDTYGQTRVPQG